MRKYVVTLCMYLQAIVSLCARVFALSWNWANSGSADKHFNIVDTDPRISGNIASSFIFIEISIHTREITCPLSLPLGFHRHVPIRKNDQTRQQTELECTFKLTNKYTISSKCFTQRNIDCLFVNSVYWVLCCFLHAYIFLSISP